VGLWVAGRMKSGDNTASASHITGGAYVDASTHVASRSFFEESL
jgi:hypothetical protein